MENESKKLENLANWAYPVSIASVFLGLEYLGVGRIFRDSELDSLTNNPNGCMNLLKGAGFYLKSFICEGVISVPVGGVLGAAIVGPTKYFLKRFK